MARTKKFKAPEIDLSTIYDKAASNPDALDEHEVRWLQDHDALPEGVDSVPVFFYLPDGTKVSNDPAFFAQQTNDEAIQALVEARAQEMVAELLHQRQTEAAVANQGEYSGSAIPQASSVRVDEVDEDEDDGDEEAEDYEDMRVTDLRAEIYRRNQQRDESNHLSMDGRKPDLVATLKADDAASEAAE